MTTWWHYLLLANLYLVLFYAFYALLLKRETFFQLNRIYLVVSAALSFVLPLVQLDWVKHLFITERVETTIYQANPLLLLQIRAFPDNRLTVGEVLGYAYCAGLLFMIAKLCLQFLRLRQLIKSTARHEPYSFFKVVQVDENLPEHRLITAHEETHSRQWHSADRLLLEVLLIISWFNPVIYLYRRAVKHLHEFIADGEAISAGVSKKHYAQLLVSQAFMEPAHQLTNTFYNSSLLKQRIIMLQKNKSKRVAMAKYGLSAPLFAAMLVLSSATLNKSTVVIRFNEKTNTLLNVPAAVASRLITAEPTKEPAATLHADTAIIIAEMPLQKETQLQLKIKSDTVPAGNKTEISAFVEQNAQPESGMQAFYSYMSQAMRYPVAARKANIQGRVIVTFIVERDGSLSDVKALRGPGYGLNEEAVRVIAASPKWKAGVVSGRAVRSQMTIPIMFTLDGKKTSDSTNTSPANEKQPASSMKDAKVDSPGGNHNSAVIENTRVDSLWGFSAESTPSGMFFGGTKNANGVPPLYILNGKAVKSIKTVNPNDIQRIEVIKDNDAIEKYGSKGANGVVIITSKHKP